jgi:membrane fusion protein, heavy metal efflux system
VKISTIAGLSLLIIAAAISGCGKSEETKAPESESLTQTNAHGEAYVDMTPDQAKAILKIEEVGTYNFPVEREAVGSVSFDEDPAIVQAQSTLVSAAATFDSTGKELERVRALGETNGVPAKEIEQATADHQTAAAALKAARDNVRALGITDGEIDEMVSAGNIPASHGQDSNSTKWVTASVIESDIPSIRLNLPVEVRVVAFQGKIFKGKVSRIYAAVDPNVHRMQMRCEVSDEENRLRSGMLANVTIQVKEPLEDTAIPIAGVVREDNGTMTAWVTTDRHRFTQRKLILGLQKDGRYEVLEGLRPGELVVTDGAIFLSNLLNAPPSD